MSRSPEEMKRRTKQFSLRVVKLVDSLPKGRTGDVLGHQLLRSGTSVAANYRAACRARSAKEFCSKMGIVEEESDESALWIELITEAKLMREKLVAELLREANEITAIAVASIKTARQSGNSKR